MVLQQTGAIQSLALFCLLVETYTEYPAVPVVLPFTSNPKPKRSLLLHQSVQCLGLYFIPLYLHVMPQRVFSILNHVVLGSPVQEVHRTTGASSEVGY